MNSNGWPVSKQRRAGQIPDRMFVWLDTDYHVLETEMAKLKWESLVEINGRMEADLLKSYLEAHGIQVELFQEAVGQHIYPVAIDGLGRVQFFVSKDQYFEARQILADYNQARQTK
jgi:hypothetical protein